MGGELGTGENAAVTGGAMIMRVPQRVGAGRRIAGLVAGDFPEARGAHVFQPHVEATMGHHLVGIGANIVAFAAMEMRRFLWNSAQCQDLIYKD